jgi:cyclophilin family peptidyl-prolyl cis-trans isomerase
MKKIYFISTVLLVFTLAACTPNTPETPTADTAPESDVQSAQSENQNSTNNSDEKVNIMKKATIETNMGNITIEFYPSDAPKTVENFQKLASSGFYNNVIFHRVIKDFMIQGGDPTGTGTGGPGYKFNDEINKNSDLYKTGYKKGIVAMANAGPNTNGSQFFIMHADYPLPPSYTIFGKVVEGLDVVDKIANSQTDMSDKPLTAVTMKSVKLSD